MNSSSGPLSEEILTLTVNLPRKSNPVAKAVASKRKHFEANTSKDKQEYRNTGIQEQVTIATTAAACAQGSSRFTPPTPDEVTAYCQERHNGIDGKEFCVSSKATKNVVGLTFLDKCGIL